MPVAMVDQERRIAGAQIFRDLAIEMLELAAADLARPLPAYEDLSRGAHETRLNRGSASRWIAGTASGDDSTMPFTLCCDAMGIDPDIVRRALMEQPGRLLAALRALAKRTPLTSSVDAPNAADGKAFSVGAASRKVRFAT